MITVLELVQWLDKLPAGASVGMLEEGTCIAHHTKDIGPETFLEIGFLPEPSRDDPICTCGICEWSGRESKLKCGLAYIPDLFSRIEVGGEVPAGECPECGGLCYLEKGDK
jgi:hypothetical protein